MGLVQFTNQAIDAEGRPVRSRVTVFRRGTNIEADDAVFANAAGGAQPNPFEAADGFVQFWANPGVYDVKIEDAVNVPPLYAPRIVAWDAISADSGGVLLFQLGDDIMRQICPLGTVLDWWRPPTPGGGTPVPVPDGWAICMGQTLTASDHGFPITGGFVMPDMRNKFVLGARSPTEGNYPGDSTAGNPQNGSPGTTTTNAPAIRGESGSNAGKDLRHTHTYTHAHQAPDHTHNFTAPDHAHAVSISGGTGTATRGSPNGYAGGGGESVAFTNHTHAVSGSGGTGFADRTLASQASYMSTTHGTQLNTGNPTVTNTDNGTLTNPGGVSTPVDMRPAYIGLLKIMKVKRS